MISSYEPRKGLDFYKEVLHFIENGLYYVQHVTDKENEPMKKALLCAVLAMGAAILSAETKPNISQYPVLTEEVAVYRIDGGPTILWAINFRAEATFFAKRKCFLFRFVIENPTDNPVQIQWGALDVLREAKTVHLVTERRLDIRELGVPEKDAEGIIVLAPHTEKTFLAFGDAPKEVSSEVSVTYAGEVKRKIVSSYLPTALSRRKVRS